MARDPHANHCKRVASDSGRDRARDGVPPATREIWKVLRIVHKPAPFRLNSGRMEAMA